MRSIGFLLLLVHGFLFVWSVGGYIEMITTKVPWTPFTNPDFPLWVLIFHWGSVLFASVSFLYCYLTHWQKTPQIMAFAYGLMALVCVVETFGFMTSKTKYLAMGAEFIAYAFILFLLYKTPYFKNRFGN